MEEAKIVIGIDPGTQVCGYSIIKKSNNLIEILDIGSIKPKLTETLEKRINFIFNELKTLFKKNLPTELAIEDSFYGKNAQSMLKLGRIQGICIALASNLNIPYYFYSPRKIKLSITGKGNSSKEYVSKVLGRYFPEKIINQNTDATDALAIAYCHLNNVNSIKIYKPKVVKKKNKWAKFISENQHMIIKR